MDIRRHIQRAFASNRLLFILCVPLGAILVAAGFAVFYLSVYCDTPDAFCYHGKPLVSESDPRFQLSQPHAFTDFFYFSIQSVTTVGFGDISANNVSMRFWVSIETLIGVFLFVSLIAVLTAHQEPRVDR